MQSINKTFKFILPLLTLSVLIFGFVAAPAAGFHGNARVLAQNGGNPPTDITLSQTSIAENNLVGDPVGTFGAVDLDAGDTFSYTLIDTMADGSDCSGNAAFTISDSSLNAAVSFNYESKASYPICVQVTDSAELTYPKAFIITITNVNEPPSAAVVHGTPPFTIAENSGSSVHVKDALGADVTIELSDVDAGDSVSLVEVPTGQPLAVGSVSGNAWLKVITGSSGLDYEALPANAKYITYTLQPKDKGGLLAPVFSVTVNVTDVNEPPIFTFGTHTINENSPVSTLVSNAFTATDPEGNNPVTISLLPDTAGDPYAAGNTFTLNSENFLVVNDNTLLNYESKTYLDINIRATDSTGKYTDIIKGKVSIKDVNEPPVFTKQDLYIKENSPVFEVPNGSDIIATDPEKKSLTYTIPLDKVTPCNPPFTIKNVTDTTTTPTTYKATVSKDAACAPLDYETTPKWDLPVIVTDGANPITETFTIWVLNVNEPITIDLGQVFLAGDSSPAGTTLGAIQIKDQDVGTQPTFLVIGGTGVNNFAVDKNTGEVSVITNSGLDYYKNPTLTLEVLVTDNGSGTGDPATSDTEWITIQLSDENDPPILKPNDQLTVAEHSANSTQVGTIAATDSQGNNITYLVVGGTGQAAFQIDAGSGKISVKDGSLVDYEDALNHKMTLTVKALDDGTPSMYSTYTYTIHLTDVEEPPIINPSTMSTYERALGSTLIGTVDASDPDQDDTLKYAITGGTGQSYFDIDQTGKVTVKPGAILTYPSPPLTLVVQVTDNHNQAASAAVTVNITPKANLAVKDIHYEPTVVIGSRMQFTVTVSNEGLGASSPYTLDITLPSAVSFIPAGSTEGCGMKTAAIVECSDPNLKLAQKGAAGDSKTYTMNAYLSRVAGDNSPAKIHFEAITNTNETDINNNVADVVFTAKKTVEVTNQNFENHTARDFYLQGADPNAEPVSYTTTEQTPNPDNVRTFLGKFSNDTLIFKKDNLLPHSKVKVSFDLYLWNYWWGISAVNGPSYWKLCQGPGCDGSSSWLIDTTFSTYFRYDQEQFKQNYPYSCAPSEQHPCGGTEKLYPPLYNAAEVGQLGYTTSGNFTKDGVYHLEIPDFAHTDSTLMLKFIGENLIKDGLTQGIWGIDNVLITISGDDGFQTFIPMTRRP